ncbi:MAG: hypothetical protein K5894_09540 [Lachnospiraceae bacterium]|nr:hypothetical protein [Lachnospiraceae bacterium]
MRSDGSIALTKLNMSVIDSSALISSSALLCASFAQSIIDKTTVESGFGFYSELEFLEENEDEAASERSKETKQINLNYDLTFEMVIAHLEALEKRREAGNKSYGNNIEKIIVREGRLLEQTLKNLEKNSRYRKSPYAEKYKTEKLKLLHKYSSPEIKEYIKNTETIKGLIREIDRRSINELRNGDYLNVLSPEKRYLNLERFINSYGESIVNGESSDRREDGYISEREMKESAKDLKRATQRQSREIRSLKQILSSVDINTPLKVNYKNGKNNSMRMNEPQGRYGISDSLSIRTMNGKKYRAESGYSGSGHRKEDIYNRSDNNAPKYDQNKYDINSLRNVLTPIRREIAINSAVSGKKVRRDEINRNLREILPEAGSELINQISMQYRQQEMGFDPLDLDNIEIKNDLEEKVKETALIANKQIREIRELKKIFTDADMTSAYSKENREEEKSAERSSRENDGKTGSQVIEKRIEKTVEKNIKRNIEKKVQGKPGKKINEILEKSLNKKTGENERRKRERSEKYNDLSRSIQKNIADNSNVMNTLNPLTREIAIRKLINGKNRDELRNFSSLARRVFPWNGSKNTDAIREKYIFRNMGYSPQKLEDIVISNDKKTEEIAKAEKSGAIKDREIRELKQTLAARDHDEDKRTEDERKKEREEKTEKRKEELERNIEINEKVRNALAPVTREIATIRLLKGDLRENLRNITGLVKSALPGSSTGTIDAIRERYAASVMGFGHENLEDLLIEKESSGDSGNKNKEIQGAGYEREKAELKKVVMKKKNNMPLEFYPPVNIEYGKSYPDMLKNAIKNQMDMGNLNDVALRGIDQKKTSGRPLTTAEKFLMGEVDETVVEDSPVSPLAARTSMTGFHPMSINTAPMTAGNPASEKQVSWVNPMFSPYGKMDDLQFKEKKKENESKENARNNNNLKLSDAEIRRTADKVFKLVEDRIKKERRRIGRI